MRRAFSHESKNKCHDLLRTKFNSQVPNVWQADYVGHKRNSERQNIGQRMDADEISTKARDQKNDCLRLDRR